MVQNLQIGVYGVLVALAFLTYIISLHKGRFGTSHGQPRPSQHHAVDHHRSRYGPRIHGDLQA